MANCVDACAQACMYSPRNTGFTHRFLLNCPGRPVHQTYVKISPPNTKTDMRLSSLLERFAVIYNTFCMQIHTFQDSTLYEFVQEGRGRWMAVGQIQKFHFRWLNAGTHGERYITVWMVSPRLDCAVRTNANASLAICAWRANS